MSFQGFPFLYCIFLFPFLLVGQNSSDQIKEEQKNNNYQNNRKSPNSNYSFPLNDVSNDSTYHAGLLIALKSNMNIRDLKSSFCLSCHDGIFVRQGHVTTNYGNPDNIDRMTIFLFNHPVAFEFTSKLAVSKNYLNDPYTTPSGLGGTIAEDLLVDGRVECVTCHNINFKHDHKEKYKLLNKSNQGSGLCLTCHNR